MKKAASKKPSKKRVSKKATSKFIIDKSLKRSKSSFFKKKLNDANEFLSKHGVPA